MPTLRSLRSAVTRPWVGPLALLTVAFLAFSVPPYAGLDPAQSRVTIPEGRPLFYPMLVAHIGFGSIALLTACLQIWPWLRAHHPAVHRWSGRLYVFAGVLPAGIAILFWVAPFGSLGPTQQVSNGMLSLLWLGTTVAGYVAARRRRFVEHREWMVRSFALSFSIVANRLWGALCQVVFVPEVLTGATPDPAVFAQAAGVSAWLSWVVNLIVAEWWLSWKRNRDLRRRRAARRDARAGAGAGDWSGTLDRSVTG